jgi:hypothetical protein
VTHQWQGFGFKRRRCELIWGPEVRTRDVECLTGGVGGILCCRGGRGAGGGGEWPPPTVRFKDLMIKAPVTMKMKSATPIDGWEMKEEVEQCRFHAGEVSRGARRRNGGGGHAMT